MGGATNTYKRFPVGIVLNPVIVGLLDLRETERLALEDVESIEATGNPLLRQRTDRPCAKSGRESQISAQHAAAIVLLRGRAGLDEFTDAAALETLSSGRPTMVFRDDPTSDIASVDLEVRTRSGRRLRREIRNAVGFQKNPLSDAQLELKLSDAAKRSGFPVDVRRLADAICRRVERCSRTHRLTADTPASGGSAVASGRRKS